MRNQISSAFRGRLVVLLASLILSAGAARFAEAAEKSLAELIRELQPPHTPIERLRAAEAIAEYGSAAVPALLPLLDRDDNTPQYACITLVRLGPEAQAAVPLLVTKIACRDCSFRRDALGALQQIGPPAAAAVPALIGLLAAEDARLRQHVSNALLGIGEPALPALIESLRQPDANLGRFACLTLQQMGAKAAPAIPALVEAAARPDDPLRDAVFLALAGIGGDALQPLIRLLESQDPQLRRCAAMALGRIGPAAKGAETALAARTADADATVRFWAVQALAHIGATSETTRQALRRARQDGDPNVRWQAITSLAAVAPTLAKQASADLLDDPNPAVRKQAQAVSDALP